MYFYFINKYMLPNSNEVKPLLLSKSSIGFCLMLMLKQNNFI